MQSTFELRRRPENPPRTSPARPAFDAAPAPRVPTLLGSNRPFRAPLRPAGHARATHLQSGGPSALATEGRVLAPLLPQAGRGPRSSLLPALSTPALHHQHESGGEQRPNRAVRQHQARAHDAEGTGWIDPAQRKRQDPAPITDAIEQSRVTFAIEAEGASRRAQNGGDEMRYEGQHERHHHARREAVASEVGGRHRMAIDPTTDRSISLHTSEKLRAASSFGTLAGQRREAPRSQVVVRESSPSSGSSAGNGPAPHSDHLRGELGVSRRASAASGGGA